MADPLLIKRKNGALRVSKTDDRYAVSVTGGGNVTSEELDKIKAYIGDDEDGADTIAKLERRMG